MGPTVGAAAADARPIRAEWEQWRDKERRCIDTSYTNQRKNYIIRRLDTVAALERNPCPRPPIDTSRVVVVGAGAFGGWTALELRRRGARVTLARRLGAGQPALQLRRRNPNHPGDLRYTGDLHEDGLRALELWGAFDPERRLLRETGVLWMFDEDDSFGHPSANVLAVYGARLDQLTVADASRRYPLISPGGHPVLFPRTRSRVSLRATRVRGRRELSGWQRAGITGWALASIRWLSKALRSTRPACTIRTVLEADGFVFACGPWLPHLFPDVVGANVSATRQEVYYFGAPAGDARFTEPHLPVWMDFAAGSRAGQIYGIPASGSSGFKVADDATGPPIDPT